MRDWETYISGSLSADSTGNKTDRVPRKVVQVADVTPKGETAGPHFGGLYPGSQSKQIVADPRMDSGLDETVLTEEQWGLIQPKRAHTVLELKKDTSALSLERATKTMETLERMRC